jgi:serine/threonine-protein kinase HipA
MRKANVFQQGALAGTLEEKEQGHYCFTYAAGYTGGPISLALPVREAAYEFDRFPPVLEGLLPEGVLLEALLRQQKVDRDDLLTQLLLVGRDVVGSLTLEPA